MRKALLLLLFPALAWAQAELFIEAELTPSKVYVGQEARLVLRVLRAPGVPPGALRPPRLGDGELSLLGVRMYEETRGGVAYQVFERSNVVVPRRAGRLVVPGAEFESAAFFTEQFQRFAVPRVVRGPERVLEVAAPPAAAGEPFLPARSLTLSETWSRDVEALSAGEPVTRTLVMVAEGLAAERLPRLEMPELPSVHVHHDQPELFTEYLESGMLGRRVQRIVLMPVSEGEVSLPAVRVRWWDVAADEPRETVLPARGLRMHSVVAPAAVPPPAPLEVSPSAVLRWFAVAILVLSAASLWLYLKGQAVRDARAKLKAACRRNDARAARDALAEWWKAARPGEKLPLTRNMASGAALREELAKLDAALYAARPWDGRALWRAAKAASFRVRAGAGAPAPLDAFRVAKRVFAGRAG